MPAGPFARRSLEVGSIHNSQPPMFLVAEGAAEARPVVLMTHRDAPPKLAFYCVPHKPELCTTEFMLPEIEAASGW